MPEWPPLLKLTSAVFPGKTHDRTGSILKLLAKRPEERVQSCRDLAALLEGQRGRQV